MLIIFFSIILHPSSLLLPFSMEGVEVPQFFLCPISLEIMKDPVTTVTGITYDRKNIEQWLFSDTNDCKVCPVTNQALPKTLDLTPNHTLRRLIQSWCTVNASKGVDRIPTPRAPISVDKMNELLRDLSSPRLVSDTLKVIETMASDSETNRRCMVHGGVAKHLVSLIVANKYYKIDCVAQALRILSILRACSGEEDRIILEPDAHLIVNRDMIESLTWVLNHKSLSRESKIDAVLLLKSIFIQAMNINHNSIGNLERLKPEFFQSILQVLRARFNSKTTKAVLHVLLMACSWGSNKTKILNSGAMADIIELELTMPDKRTSELNLSILDQLCSCPDGRELFLQHGAAIAMVAKRILRVSPAADEKAVGILTAISKYSATSETLHEMLRVGAVSKLCMVLQANCSTDVKDKARRVLRLRCDVWRDSPCIAVYLLTRYPQY